MPLLHAEMVSRILYLTIYEYVIQYVCDICKLLRHFDDIWLFFILKLSDRTLTIRIRIQPSFRTTSRVKNSLTFVYSIESNSTGA
jgi:hypothetical protein